MKQITDEQHLQALESAIIGLSSGLQGLDKDSEAYQELRLKVDDLFSKWRDLDKKLNPCNIRINE